MGVDERILHLVRTEMDKALTLPDGGEFREGPGLISRIDDLHRELHALATRVDEVMRRLTVLESEPGTSAAPVRRTRQGKESAQSGEVR